MEDRDEIELLKNSLNRVVELGVEMRSRQDQYFKSRNAVNLKYSKIAEDNFDNYVRLLKKRGYGQKPENPSQKTIF